MKKILLILLAMMLMGCQSTSNGESEAVTKKPTIDTQTYNGKILIAYFTWADNTQVDDPSSIDVGCLLYTSTLNLIRATHHYSIEERHRHQYYDTMCIAPGVMAHTGMETADLLLALVQEFQPDLVIAIDALCAQSDEKICRVIQMNNVGIYPGSGIGNHRKNISEATMGVPVLAIGVPTAVSYTHLEKQFLR